VPELSRFLGIVIRMYYDDHPPPHFHARYGEYEVIVEIGTGAVDGRFPLRALRHVLEWQELHREALSAAWELAEAGEPLRRIAPLE
jgi:hypothetical protein